MVAMGGSVGAGAIGGVVGWAARGTYTDRDPGSDWRVVQRVRALHHSTALGRITQTERGGRARHLEYITEGRHIWSKDLCTYHEAKQDETRRE